LLCRSAALPLCRCAAVLLSILHPRARFSIQAPFVYAQPSAPNRGIAVATVVPLELQPRPSIFFLLHAACRNPATNPAVFPRERAPAASASGCLHWPGTSSRLYLPRRRSAPLALPPYPTPPLSSARQTTRRTPRTGPRHHNRESHCCRPLSQ
jgi:hypothetical protein